MNLVLIVIRTKQNASKKKKTHTKKLIMCNHGPSLLFRKENIAVSKSGMKTKARYGNFQ